MEFTAEVFDQVQRVFDRNGLNDHQLHAVLRFGAGRGPDPEILKRAVIASIEAIPILGTRYVDGDRPRWVGLDPTEFARAFVMARTRSSSSMRSCWRAPTKGGGPRSGSACSTRESPAMAVTMNHMVGDGAGFKGFLYFLGAIYGGLAADPGFKPAPLAGDRAIGRVLGRIGLRAKFKALWAQGGDRSRAGDHRFPLSASGAVEPFIVTRRLDRARTEAIRNYGHGESATLNDLVLTAFYRCLFRRLKLTAGAVVAVPVMVDMRRYLGEGDEIAALTNLSSMVATRLDYRPGEAFAATLRRAKAAMDERKGGNIGLVNFVTLDLIFRLCGSRWANRLLRSRLSYPLICMTNIGILDAARLAFGDRRPSDAYVCGSIKYKPYFQIAVSSYQGELTLSSNLYGTAGDREAAAAVLGEIDAELPDTVAALPAGTPVAG